MRHLDDLQRLLMPLNAVTCSRAAGAGYSAENTDGQEVIAHNVLGSLSLEMLPPNRFREAQSFYVTVGYGGAIAGDCSVFAAVRDGTMIGVVRLAPENGVTVLRGMTIGKEHQRIGIGTRLLQFMEPHMAGSDVYCLPHDWLEGFYGQAGFVKIALAQAPPHLQQRLDEQRPKHPDLIVMVRKP